MYRIAFDINGNDNGPKAAIQASVDFLQKNDNYEIIMVGDKKQIDEIFAKSKKLQKPKTLHIIDNPNMPSNVENLHKSLREDTSINTALDLVKENKADVIMSSGDSGTYFACATYKLRRLNGVTRSAFMPIMPTIVGRKFLMLDVGANIETKTEYLVEWAKIANVYAKVLLKLSTPRISLINIGTESYKGLEIVKEANDLLKQNSNLNYTGYVEPRKILEGITDVAVIDGYGGNLVLKSLEGTALSLKNLLKSKIILKPMRKFGYFLARNAFKEAGETLDYRNVGAAWLIGLNGLAIKCHGNSDEKAYKGALNQIKLVLEGNVLEEVKKELEAKNE